LWTYLPDVRAEMWTEADAALLLTPVSRVRETVTLIRSVAEVWSVETTTANSLETFSILKMIAA